MSKLGSMVHTSYFIHRFIFTFFNTIPTADDHAFFLFNKITMTANGRYLGIKEKDGKFIGLINK